MAGVILMSPRVVVTEEGWCFYGRPRQKLVRLVEVLRESGTPLHVHTIKERLNQRLSEPSTSHAVNEFLSRETQVFVRVGPGTFALREWGNER
ncbi:MAG: HTH domain-containing protein [Chloroflexota bacterium]|nr:HTH domain-containing protein [Chloroflexota bacterium]